jgi:hypothetical protein
MIYRVFISVPVMVFFWGLGATLILILPGGLMDSLPVALYGLGITLVLYLLDRIFEPFDIWIFEKSIEVEFKQTKKLTNTSSVQYRFSLVGYHSGQIVPVSVYKRRKWYWI